MTEGHRRRGRDREAERGIEVQTARKADTETDRQRESRWEGVREAHIGDEVELCGERVRENQKEGKC